MVLGGYGAVGREVAKCLAGMENGPVTIAGPRRERAAAAAAALKQQNARVPVAARVVDVTDEADLRAALREHSAFVDCAPAKTGGAELLAASALEAGTDGVIVTHDLELQAALTRRKEDIKAAGLCAVIDAGADPGLPGLIGRLAGDMVDDPVSLHISARYRDPHIGRAGAADLIDSAKEKPLVFDGEWRRASTFESRLLSFPGGLGRAPAIPVHLPELDALVTALSLDRLSLLHAGVNWLTDLLVLAAKAGLDGVIGRERFAGLVRRAIERHTRGPCGLAVTARAEGPLGAARVEVTHSDLYRATATMAALATKRVLDTRGRTPGVLFLHECLCLDGILADLKALGFCAETRLLPHPDRP